MSDEYDNNFSKKKDDDKDNSSLKQDLDQKKLEPSNIGIITKEEWRRWMWGGALISLFTSLLIGVSSAAIFLVGNYSTACLILLIILGAIVTRLGGLVPFRDDPKNLRPSFKNILNKLGKIAAFIFGHLFAFFVISLIRGIL